MRDLQPGDRVILLANNNWGERRKVPLATVHKVDHAADALQMAMLKVNPATAYLLLKDYQQLMEGDWIIQNAPLSSVGQCVIQIAKQLGVRTVNVVRRADMTAKVLSLGGSIAVEDGPDLAKRVADLIGHDPVRLALDAVAGPGVNRLAECLVEGAPIINYGMLSTEACVLSAEQSIFRNISLRGFWLSKLLSRMPQNKRVELLDTLANMVTSGKLRMEVDSVFSIGRDTSCTAACRTRWSSRQSNGYYPVLPPQLVRRLRNRTHDQQTLGSHAKTNQYDCIVIGSGIGGLTVATLLARVGKKRVLVLERHFKPGGFTHSFRRQEFEWDVGLHYSARCNLVRCRGASWTW